MRLRLAAATLAALLAGACATPVATGPKLAPPLAADPPILRTVLPDGANRHPAVLLVTACDAPLLSSRAALYLRYAETLRAEGFAAAILAWPGSGAGDPACNAASPAAIASNIRGALEQLRSLPQVDPGRTHIVGWGHGGRAVLEVVMAEKRLPGLVSAVAVYPDCPKPRAWNSEITLFLALAERDTATPPQACHDWAATSDGPGPVAITRYTGVAHGFDVHEAGDPAYAPWMTGTPLIFDASTAWQFRQDLLKFLRLNIDAGS